MLARVGDDPSILFQNANFDKNGFGPLWGTFHTETSEGAWDGTWTQKVTASGSSINEVSFEYEEIEWKWIPDNVVETDKWRAPGGG